jgi:hypothetical protein
MMLSLLCSLTFAAAPDATVKVEPLPFDAAALKANDKARVTIRVVERGQEVSYSGVPLRTLLVGATGEKTAMPKLRELADAVILVHAEDGYQAALSAAEVVMDTKGERYILALERDGKALEASHGPVRLIVPADSEHVRWVRMVSAVDLIRLPKPPAKVKAAQAPGNR